MIRAAPRGRGAYSLVEIIIFSALGAVVLGALYMLFSAGSRQGNRLEEKLRGVQSAQLLLERLGSDLRAAIVTTGRVVRVESIAGGSRNRLSFDCYDGARNDHRFDGALPVRHVAYLFDGATHLVSRDEMPIPMASFASVSFSYDKAQPGTDGALAADTVTVVMVTAPPDQLDAGKPDPRSTSTFVETVCVTPGSPGDPLHTWVPAWFPPVTARPTEATEQ